MTDEAAFLAKIIAEPDEDVHRLVYADWLQDHGRPERAEFIRVQCEIAALVASEPAPPAHVEPEVRGAWLAGYRSAMHREMSTMAAFLGDRECRCVRCLQKRECELWAVLSPEQFLSGLVPNTCWRLRDEPLRDRQHGWVVRRGFVEEAKLTAADWLAHGDAVRAAHPVTRVALTTLPEVQWSPRVGPPNNGRHCWLTGLSRAQLLWVQRIVCPEQARQRIALELLKDAWPGVAFALPPAGTAAHTTYDVQLVAGAPLGVGDLVGYCPTTGVYGPSPQYPPIGTVLETYEGEHGRPMAVVRLHPATNAGLYDPPDHS